MHSDKERTLWEIAQSLHQHLNIDQLILHIITKIKEEMSSEGVSVILYDEIEDRLIFSWAESDADGLALKLKQISLPTGEGIAGSVFASGKAEIVTRVSNDNRHYKKIDHQLGFDTQSMIATPLINKDKTIGVLEVLNKKGGDFDNDDLTFATTLAPIIAMALDNARMYGELAEANKKLEDINKAQDELIQVTRVENIALRKEIEKRYRFDEIIGNSSPMCHVLQLCETVIDTDITVLVEGETGTGKELIARCIHYNSRRKDKPFVTQNCGGTPETLLTSELFGHKRGAFTGAVEDKKGLFEIAHDGTIFLDEVGEMSPAMQTSLLRVLQDGEIRPLGSNRNRKVNTRVISATHRHLAEDVAQGRFREDLFYRLNVFTIDVPPLRERSGDVSLLAQHFLAKHSKKMDKKISRISPAALKLLEDYQFPGNVRELENEIERAIALAKSGGEIEPLHLSENIASKSIQAGLDVKVKGSLKKMVESLEISVLEQLLEKHEGNRTRIAKELGMSRYGLSKKLQRYGL
jgi:Nif-specific regulatory protein